LATHNRSVSAIFAADDGGKIYARTIAEEIGVPLVILNPLTYENEETESYFTSMDKNLSLIKELFENE
jgi:ABC-type Zn uptake system ZnuABC Zn-binding protein ZnuA